ncbi:MAG: PilZ domain-containing protein, partial [Thermoanaerobaculia bacterium]|nr:PilZ domain-containing protein [Thermoanaerobaculia bacterium]
MSESEGNAEFSDADRRRAQRIHLDDRPEGSFNGVPITMIELGLAGLKISSSEPMTEGTFGELIFRYEGEDVRARCRVARAQLQTRLSEAMGELVYHIGLEITDIDPVSARSLKNLITQRVAEALEKQRANAMGESPEWDR